MKVYRSFSHRFTAPKLYWEDLVSIESILRKSTQLDHLRIAVVKDEKIQEFILLENGVNELRKNKITEIQGITFQAFYKKEGPEIVVRLGGYDNAAEVDAFNVDAEVRGIYEDIRDVISKRQRKVLVFLIRLTNIILGLAAGFLIASILSARIMNNLSIELNLSESILTVIIVCILGILAVLLRLFHGKMVVSPKIVLSDYYGNRSYLNRNTEAIATGTIITVIGGLLLAMIIWVVERVLDYT